MALLDIEIINVHSFRCMCMQPQSNKRFLAFYLLFCCLNGEWNLRVNHDFKKPVYVRYGARIMASWFTFIREEILDDADQQALEKREHRRLPKEIYFTVAFCVCSREVRDFVNILLTTVKVF